MAGMKAYDEYINGSSTKDSQMSYLDYLDYWMKEYFEINYKYSTAKRYNPAVDLQIPKMLSFEPKKTL